MKLLRWLPESAADLESIRNYLAEHHPTLARPTMVRIYEAIRSLRQFPHRGRIGQQHDTRELVLAPLPYVVIYRVGEEAVVVLHIYHGAQQRQALM
jgi:toxin ParE1/3/4